MEMRGTSLIFMYDSICVIDVFKITLGAVRVLGALFPGRLCLAADQGRDRFHDWAARHLHLPVGQISGCLGIKCLESWAMGGALAHKSSDLHHRGGIFL